MYAVASMKISYKNNESEPWKDREACFMFQDVTDTERVVEYFKRTWNDFLDSENLNKEKCDERRIAPVQTSKIS